MFPVINHRWINKQTAIVKQMKQSCSVDVRGDRRCYSPQHLAKFGTYTLMDEKTNLKIEFSGVQVTETTSSNTMENEGCDHISGKYRWRTSIKKCGYATISQKVQEGIKWLKAGSPVHVALEEVVTNCKLLKDIAKQTVPSHR